MTDYSDSNYDSMSNLALQEHIGKFIQHHRLNQNRSQTDMAKEAGISRSTLSLLERGEKVTLETLLQALRVLGLLNILQVFDVKEEISPVEYAKLQKKKRKRARTKDTNKEDDLGW